MRIPQAIEILDEIVRARSFTRSKEPTLAIQLGIEALRRIEATRLVRKTGTIVLLPGETTD